MKCVVEEVLSDQLPDSILSLFEQATNGASVAVSVIEQAIRRGANRYPDVVRVLLEALGSGNDQRRQLAQRILTNTLDQTGPFLRKWMKTGSAEEQSGGGHYE